MSEVVADLAKKTNQLKDKARNTGHEVAALDRRYGQIGISAVAAAARYQGGAKNPAYAPAVIKWYDRADDAAA